jgi:hypothetical protein
MAETVCQLQMMFSSLTVCTVRLYDTLIFTRFLVSCKLCTVTLLNAQPTNSNKTLKQLYSSAQYYEKEGTCLPLTSHY